MRNLNKKKSELSEEGCGKTKYSLLERLPHGSNLTTNLRESEAQRAC